jgi:predicted nucleotidyltransferase
MEDKIEKIEKNLEQTDAEAAILFGSYVRGEDYNDYDVAVFTEESVNK